MATEMNAAQINMDPETREERNDILTRGNTHGYDLSP